MIQSRSDCKLFPRSRERTGCVNTAQSVESVTDHILKLTQHQPPLSHCASWLQKAFSRAFEKKGYIMIRMAISSSYFQRAKKCQVVNLRRWKEKWLFCYSDSMFLYGDLLSVTTPRVSLSWVMYWHTDLHIVLGPNVLTNHAFLLSAKNFAFR